MLHNLELVCKIEPLLGVFAPLPNLHNAVQITPSLSVIHSKWIPHWEWWNGHRFLLLSQYYWIIWHFKVYRHLKLSSEGNKEGMRVIRLFSNESTERKRERKSLPTNIPSNPSCFCLGPSLNLANKLLRLMCPADCLHFVIVLNNAFQRLSGYKESEWQKDQFRISQQKQRNESREFERYLWLPLHEISSTIF